MPNGGAISFEDCTFNNTPYFIDSGIENMPSGLECISFSIITQDKETDYDTIYLVAYFKDQKLCKTTGSITGSGCEKKYQNKTSIVEFKIKHN